MRRLTAVLVFFLSVGWGCHSRCFGASRDDVREGLAEKGRDVTEKAIEDGDEDKIPGPLRGKLEDQDWYKDKVEERAIKTESKELKMKQKAKARGAQGLPLKKRVEEKQPEQSQIGPGLQPK